VAFTVPNEGSATYSRQAGLDSGDLAIMVAALKGDGVLTGCDVQAQSTPDMTVKILAGQIQIGTLTPTMNPVTLAVTPGHVSLNRLDLVVANTTGVASVVPGVPAQFPVFPALPTNTIALAAIYVQTVATLVAPGNLTDKRCFVRNNSVSSAKRYRAGNATALTPADFALTDWGFPGSTVTGVTGTDQGGGFSVTSAGSGQLPSNKVTLTWTDGPWPVAPQVLVVRAGGAQSGLTPSWTSFVDRLEITLPGTPVAGQTFTFRFLVMG
jgi:hypothetical protein